VAPGWSARQIDVQEQSLWRKGMAEGLPLAHVDPLDGGPHEPRWLWNFAGSHFHDERPGRALVPRRLAEPPEGLLGDLDKAPTAQQTVMILANLHNISVYGSADLAHFERSRGIEPGDVPCVDGWVVPTKCGAVHVLRLSRLLVSAKPSRREDPHVLDCPPIEHPTEMPLAFRAASRSVQWVEIDIDVPGSNELAVEVQFGG
jgi:hypothetical protein